MSPDLFTCKTCKSHDLRVEHTYTLKHGPHWQTIFEWGYLDDYHQWDYEEREVVEDGTDWDDLEPEEAEAWQEWDGEGEAPTEAEALDHEFYVRCDGCEREIPFGWSHPDRVGRIWPVECTDFNQGWPWRMEPRYTASDESTHRYDCANCQEGDYA